MFPDFESGDLIMSYTFFAFKNIPSLKLIMHGVGDGNWVEHAVDASKKSDRAVENILEIWEQNGLKLLTMAL